ncbi:MAG: hypothetical protein AB8B96_09750 [Lysobacterales bacterium]
MNNKLSHAAQNAALLLIITVFAGCASTQKRAMNPGEKTAVSAEVAKMVEEMGEVDVRFAENVYCERVRRVGTHLVTRICFDSREAARKSKGNMHRLSRGIGSGTAGCVSGNCSGADLGTGRALPTLPNL